MSFNSSIKAKEYFKRKTHAPEIAIRRDELQEYTGVIAVKTCILCGNGFYHDKVIDKELGETYRCRNCCLCREEQIVKMEKLSLS